MEKMCDFCTALRPVIYCKADAAHLCLSCDLRVHSANALSSRHLRTLLCELCKYRPAYVRCFGHKKFMCRGCDRSLHEVSSQHQRQVLRSYMGCPSPKDFAALWGFDLNELENGVLRDRFPSKASVSADGGMINLDIPSQSCLQTKGSLLAFKSTSETSVFGAESEAGSSSHQIKIYQKDQYQQDTSIVLQQIIGLRRLQLTEEDNSSSLICHAGPNDTFSSKYDTSQKVDEDSDNFSQNLHSIHTDVQKLNGPLQELKVEPFSSPFSQLEQLTSSSNVGIPLHADPFWPCKSPVRSSQFWAQNMQDLGVCEEFDCFDNFNIPEVDMTFQNFEELFGGDQDPTRTLLDDKDLTCSSLENSTSFGRSDDGYQRPVEDASTASYFHITSSAHVDREMGPPEQAHNYHGSLDSPRPIRSSNSTLSFSISRRRAESSGTDCLDSGVYPIIAGGEPSFDSIAMGNAHTSTMRYKEKKKGRMNEKKIQYSSQKARAGVCKRIKGRSIKAEGYESDTVDVARSF